MSVLPRFATALAGLDSADLSGPTSLPLRLAIGATQVLHADGAGISVLDALRVPLGGSSADADVIERLQVTLGEGPCLHAFHTGEPVLATPDLIAGMWPVFNDRMLTETRIRSVAALPLQTPTRRVGALDVYWNAPTGATTMPLADAAELADHIAYTLLAEPRVTTMHGVSAPAWVDATAAQRRMQVWQAVGMLNAACAMSNLDAIAVLRAHAFSHDTTLDELAEDLVSGRVPLYDVAPQTSAT